MNNLEVSVIKRSMRRAGKGGKMIRWGPRISEGVRDKTPQGIATHNFRRELKNFEVDTTSISVFVDEVSRMEKTRFMNMKVLAATYAFIRKYDITDFESLNANNDKFSDDYIMEFITSLIYNKSGTSKVNDEPKVIRSKIVSFKQEILRYIFAIFNHRLEATTAYNIEDVLFNEERTLQDEADILDEEDEQPEEVVESVYNISDSY